MAYMYMDAAAQALIILLVGPEGEAHGHGHWPYSESLLICKYMSSNHLGENTLVQL
jgi:hypothetical protein